MRIGAMLVAVALAGCGGGRGGGRRDDGVLVEATLEDCASADLVAVLNCWYCSFDDWDAVGEQPCDLTGWPNDMEACIYTADLAGDYLRLSAEGQADGFWCEGTRQLRWDPVLDEMREVVRVREEVGPCLGEITDWPAEPESYSCGTN